MIVKEWSAFVDQVSQALGSTYTASGELLSNGTWIVNSIGKIANGVEVALEVSEIGLISSIHAVHDVLTLVSNKTSMSADGSDIALVTCSNSIITNDVNLTYEVYGLDGSMEMAGAVDVVNGMATLNFSTAVPDIYTIRFAREGATDYEDGYVTVEAI